MRWRGPFDDIPTDDAVVSTVLMELAAQCGRPPDGHHLVATFELEDAKPGRFALTAAVFIEALPEDPDA